MPVRYATRRVNLSLIVDELCERRINVGLIASEPCNEESECKFDSWWTLQLGDKFILALNCMFFLNSNILICILHVVFKNRIYLYCKFNSLWKTITSIFDYSIVYGKLSLVYFVVSIDYGKLSLVYHVLSIIYGKNMII